MTITEYQEKAMRTVNSLIPLEQLNEGALGLSGEAGEVSDLVKKHIFQGHPFKKDKLIEELGDVMWYIALLCHSQNLSLHGIMQRNIDKLEQRYPNGFSIEDSINRVDTKTV